MTDKATTTDPETLAENSYHEMSDYLENLLTRQLERLRNYDLDKALLLAEEAGMVAARLGQFQIFDRPDFSENRRRIKGLYKDISLLISVERQEVDGKLKTIRKSLRALGAYSNAF